MLSAYPKRIRSNDVKHTTETTDATSKMTWADMAAMAGIDLVKTSGQDASCHPNLYPDIVHSTPFLLNYYSEKVTDKEKKYTTTII